MEEEKVVYNKEKTEIIENPNLEYGYLQDDVLQVGMTDEISEIKEEGFWKVIAEYPNGGKDVEWIVTVQGVEACPPQPIMQDILVYIPHYTDAELEDIEKSKEMTAKYGYIWAAIEAIETRLAILQLDLHYIFAGGNLENEIAIKEEYRELYEKLKELQQQVP